MEQQVQGLVLVDGEWVSRTTDVYQIMARAQQQTDTEMREPEEIPQVQVPEMGILSRTVFESPLVKFILSANIRRKDLNDVVLIGETFIHLKEIRDYGHLCHIATKSDFNGRILAARVFGAPRKAQVNRGSSSLLTRPAMHSRGRSLTQEEANTLSSEVILLTLSSRTLMFLWAQQTAAGGAKFRQKTVKLPAGTSRFDAPGTFLAVDSKCRAIAVAAVEGRFMLYQTTSVEKWREDTRAGQEGTPIVDERIIPIQGRIMHMEFLSSVNQDDSHVVLLFILIHNGKTKVTCYDWDCRYNLSTAVPRVERAAIDYEDRNPHLIIPLPRSPEFLLVCQDHIAHYRDILAGTAERYSYAMPPEIPPLIRPGDGKCMPRWVQWHSALRNPDFAKEAFYVAREDGMVMYVERGHSIQITDAGNWSYPIDTAFACLSVDNSEFSQSFPDVLIAGGVGSDGHLCKVGAWPMEYSYSQPYDGVNRFAPLESMPNWTPLSDFAVVRLPSVQSPEERRRHTLLIANGRAPHGVISELRLGLKAIVDDSFGGMAGCTGLWVIDYNSDSFRMDGREFRKHYVTFLINLPPESIVIRIGRTSESGSHGEFWSSWNDGFWEKTQVPSEDEPAEDDIVRDDETLAACRWRDQLSIQVTRKQAMTLRRPQMTQAHVLPFSGPVLFAATRTGFDFIAVAYREQDTNILEVIAVQEDGTLRTHSKLRHELEQEPTCIDLLNFNGLPHVFVSAFDSRLTLLRIQDSSLLPVYDDWLEHNSAAGKRMLCESAVLLTNNERGMLVFGTRDGSLLNVTLEWREKCYERTSQHLVRMGSTAVSVTACATDPSTAFVSCGSDFCRVRHVANARLDIESVWFTDRRNPGYQQSSIAAIDQLSRVNKGRSTGRDLGGFVFAVSGDQMVFAQMDYDVRWPSHEGSPFLAEQSKAVPRTLSIGATPTRLAYSDKLRKMVIATTEVKEERGHPDGYRAAHSSLRLLDPSSDTLREDVEIKEEPAENAQLSNYERVYTIVDWVYNDERGHKYHLTIVGTGYMHSPGVEKGRRLILKGGKAGLKLQKESKFSEAVRCIAMYDNTHMISVIGRTLMIEEYNDGRWAKRASHDLTSPAVHLTVSAPYIYISTADHSHICYCVNTQSNLGETHFSFSQIFTDSRQRASAHHLVLTLDKPNSLPTTLVLLSDKTCNLTALHHAPHRPYRNAATTLFTTTLPRSITRLHQGTIRPPWRCPSTPTPGLLADDILGSCSDGTIYSLSILTLPALHLLRFLQNLLVAKRDRDPENAFTVVRKSSGDMWHLLVNGRGGEQESLIAARDVDPQVARVGNEGKGRDVDADLLIRELGDGRDEKMVRGLVEDDTDERVKVVFAELVEGILGIGREVGEEERYGAVGAWLGNVLMPLL